MGTRCGVAERISQLGGDPNFDPATLAAGAHTTYETFSDDDLVGMLKENLAAERIVIATDQEIIRLCRSNTRLSG